MPRVLIACDKFKGSATSQQIANALGRGLRRVAGIEVSAIAVADGGDGTLDACDRLGYERITRTVAGPDGTPVSAQLSLDRSRHRAVIEVAAVAGLALVSRDGRIRPDAEAERATTAGVGELILSALDEGARDVILGLGGSATTDAGAGMLRALGLHLVDASGERVTDLRRLGDVRLIDLTTMDPRLAETRFIAATDVTNPLTGPQGAAAVYGPQKGLRHDRIDDVDRALGSFATVTEDTLGCYGASQAPGAGAAGGLGFAAGTYLGAEIVSGADLLLDLAGFDELAASADVVITGEGRIDDQTLSGKAPAVVARRARDLGKAVVAVCGTCEATDDSPLRDTYTSIHALTDVNSDVAACIRDPLPLVTEIGARIGARLGLGATRTLSAPACTVVRMTEILSPSQLVRARESGRLVGGILQTLRDRARPGTNLLDIDGWTRDMIVDAGAESCYVDYAPSFGSGPFGHYICTSVNDAVLHGLPHDQRLAEGDLLTLDLAVSLNGIAADAAISFVVGGNPAPEDERMIATTERALAAGIAAASPKARIGDISHAMGAVLKEAGYPINMEFGGHGIGTTMHQDPHVANDGRPGRGQKLRPGLLLALEPWVMVDTDQLAGDPDGWTLRSATGCRTAHSEHTIAITDGGAEILTLPTTTKE